MADHAPVLDLSKYVETRFFGIRPHLRGRHLPVATLAYGAQNNHHDIAALMDDYTVTEAEVLAALLYYAEHKAIIDAQEAAYQKITPEEWMTYGDAALTNWK